MTINKKPAPATSLVTTIRLATLTLTLAVTLLTLACTRGANPEEGNTNGNQAAQQQKAASSNSPLVQQTLSGDTERILLHIATAKDNAKNNKWQDAAASLRTANKEVDSALSRKPRLTPEFEALKAAIDRAIGAIERRDKDAEAQLTELQLRIGAIKTNIQ